MKRCSVPVCAPASATNRRASRVISVNPCPWLSTESVAVAINSAATDEIADNRLVTAASASPASGLVEHVLLEQVLLQGLDHLDQPAPDLLHEAHELVQLRVARQLDARLLG